MGTTFLYACNTQFYLARSNLFLTHESLDLIPRRSKYQIAIFGWHDDVNEEEIEHLLRSLKFYPKKVTKVPIKLPSATEGNDSMVIVEFDRMRNTKIAMTRLQMLKKRWKISPTANFYAYPKLVNHNPLRLMYIGRVKMRIRMKMMQTIRIWMNQLTIKYTIIIFNYLAIM